jgi:hypothetical protein
MPSLEHEALALLFGNRPDLAAELLQSALNVKVPAYEKARVESADLTDWHPAEHRADNVIVYEAGDPVLAVVVEIQRGRDPAKRWSWPVYLTGLRARRRCPVILLVICVDSAVGEWCAQPIDLGHPGWTLAPLVLKPGAVPVVTDRREAVRSPELATLSAMVHGSSPGRREVFDALLSGVATVDDERAKLYIDIVCAVLPQIAKHELEEMMLSGTREYKSDFARKYVAQGRAEGEALGRAEGEATAILTVLAARGIPVPDSARARITGCTDLTVLETWIGRAALIDSIDALFD